MNDKHHILQIIKFQTWKRVNNNVAKEPILEHVHVQDPTTSCNISAITPLLGDHKILIIAALNKLDSTKIIIKFSWQTLLDESAIVNYAVFFFIIYYCKHENHVK